MTVPVVALFLAKSGSEKIVEKLFRSVIETTLAEEGCIRYQLNCDRKDPRRFVWTEEWQSQTLLDLHLNAPHIQKLFSELPQYIESSEIITLNPLAGGAVGNTLI